MSSVPRKGKEGVLLGALGPFDDCLPPAPSPRRRLSQKGLRSLPTDQKRKKDVRLYLYLLTLVRLGFEMKPSQRPNMLLPPAPAQ